MDRTDEVQLHVDERGNARVMLNRPDALNALSRSVNRRLLEVAEKLAADPGVRAIVITGAGERAFCAGADLKERKGVGPEETAGYVDAIAGAINAWARLPKPTIAALNGHALGGGLELALACDFRVAVTGAEFGLTEVRLGILPGAGGTQRLPRLIGVARAKELILLGRRIETPRALEIGLVHQMVAPEELATAIDRLLNELSGCAPLSVAKAKESIDRGIDMELEAALALERRCYDVTLFTEDRNEGLRAFAERRRPNYQGK